jgi:hypothetical protein
MKILMICLGVLFLVLITTVFFDYSFNRKVSLIGFDSQPSSTQKRQLPSTTVVSKCLSSQ